MLTVFSKVMFSLIISGAAGGAIAGIVSSSNNRYKHKEELRGKDLKNSKLDEVFNVEKNLEEVKLGNSLQNLSSISENLKQTPEIKESFTKETKNASYDAKKEGLDVEMNKAKVKSPKKTRIQRAPELEGREKWDSEISKRNILVESVYKAKYINGEDQFKNFCILYSVGENIDREENFDITEGRTKKYVTDSCDGATFWSIENSSKHNNVGLWIRGKRDAVNDLISSNWDNLKQENYINNKQEYLKIEKNHKGNLNESCKLEIDKEDWLEIACLSN